MPEPALAASGPAPDAAARPRCWRSKQLQAWYGESHILHGVSLEIRPGELVTLLGRNGAGKTTTLRSLLGMVPRRQGSVLVDGTETIRLPSAPHRAAGHRDLPGGARHLRQPRRGGEPPAPAAGPSRRNDPRGRPGAVPESPRAAEESGHQALGRRAADAGHRTDPPHRSPPAPAGRAHRGAGPRHRAADRRHHPPAEGRRIHHPAGGAESEIRLLHRGSSLRDGPRPRGGPDSRRPFPVQPARRSRRISVCNSLTPQKPGASVHANRFTGSRPRLSPAPRRPRPGQQGGEDRRPQRSVRPVHRPRRARLGGRREDGGRGVRQQGRRHADRDRHRRSPEQAGHRLEHRHQVDRRGRRGRHRRRTQLRRRAGGGQGGGGQEQGLHRFRRGHGRTSPARTARRTPSTGPTTPGPWPTAPARRW